MDSFWFQVEFWSQMEQRWIALFSHEPTSQGAEAKAREWLRESRSRVVKVTQKTEVVWQSHQHAAMAQKG
jgi:hypothetical protein